MKIAFIIGYGENYGSGHLVRINVLKKILEEKGYFINLFLVNKKEDIVYLDLKNYDLIIKDCRDSNKKIFNKLKKFPLITFDDYYNFNENNYLYILNAIPSLKNYGNTNNIEYLILNNYRFSKENKKINYNDILNNKKNIAIKKSIKEDKNNNNYKILVTFGLYDPYKLSLKFALFLSSLGRKNILEIFNITTLKQIVFILPERFYIKFCKNKNDIKKNRSLKDNSKFIKKYNIIKNFIFFTKTINNEKKIYNCLSNYTVIRKVDNFYEYLNGFEMVITHFGLTLYEALARKKKIMLVNPTKYHNKLALKYFNDINCGCINNLNIDCLKKISKKNYDNNYNNYIRKENKKSEFKHHDIKFKGEEFVLSLIKTFDLKYKNKTEILCPICLNSNNKTVIRSEKYNLYRCKRCKSIFKYDFILNETIFEKKYTGPEYFKGEYRKIYGKTYLEDKNNISKVNNKRIKIIDKIFLKKYLKFKKEINILDIGSAYGFFLEDINKFLSNNYKNVISNCEGVELNEDGIRYSQNKGFYIYDKSFLLSDIEKKYDIITSWFTIEHISDINAVFHKINLLLNNNGIVAFSVPSLYGPSFLFNKKEYIKNRPEDHFYDFTKKSIIILLKKHGFKLIKFRIENPHFERFKKYKKILSFLFGKKVYTLVANKINFSDTIEVYAKKS